MKIEYVANDGTRFDNEIECLDYEVLIVNAKNVNDTLKQVKEYCKRVPNIVCDVNCPFMGICGTPVCDWELD